MKCQDGYYNNISEDSNLTFSNPIWFNGVYMLANNCILESWTLMAEINPSPLRLLGLECHSVAKYKHSSCSRHLPNTSQAMWQSLSLGYTEFGNSHSAFTYVTTKHNKEHFYSPYILGSWNPGDSQHIPSEAENLQLNKLNSLASHSRKNPAVTKSPLCTTHRGTYSPSLPVDNFESLALWSLYLILHLNNQVSLHKQICLF